MPAVKRKYVGHSVETKYQAMLDVEKGEMSKSDIAKMYGLAASTLSTWIKSADKIKEMCENCGSARKRLRTCKHPDVEDALFSWFKEARDKQIPLSGPILQNRAVKLAADLGHSDFKCSDGWLSRFKERHAISFRVLSGEAASVQTDSAQLETWHSVTLPSIMSKYSPDNIYNADETGLFFKLQPNKSLVYKGERCHGGKQSKDRLTVLPCANMSGSDKLPLLVIGKSQKPRRFKGVKSLPTDYKANRKAWMTKDLFSEWLKKQDQRFRLKNKRVALILDNASSHGSIKLTNIELFFLPPNTTSCTQPMDQGIIKNLKHKYRRQSVEKMCRAMEEKEDFAINVLDAMHMVQRAWLDVTPETIKHCFKHAKFVCETSDDDADRSLQNDAAADSDDAITLARLMSRAQASGIEFDGTFDDFVAADSDTITNEPLTDAAIISAVAEKYAASAEPCDEESDDENDSTTVTQPPTADDAMELCSRLRQHIQFQDDASEMYEHISKLECFITKAKNKSVKQTKLDAFFKLTKEY